jgi:hypothetical protein
MYPLEDEVMQAFKDSDILMVEADLSITPDNMASLMSAFQYENEKTLLDELTPEVQAKFEKLITETQLPKDYLIKNKPVMVSLILMDLLIEQSRYSAIHGVDQYFIDKAKASNKPIAELEGMAYQLNLLANLPHGDVMLSDMIDSFSMGERYLDQLVAIWKEADLDALYALTIENVLSHGPGAQALMENLLFKRNLAMAKDVAKLLQENSRVFVVIGAAHLVGKDSVIDHLDDQFSVTSYAK